MEDDKGLSLKDEEINRLTSQLTKSGKKEFGQAFKSATTETGNSPAVGDETSEPANIVSQAGNVVQSDISEGHAESTVEPTQTAEKPSEDERKKELYSIVKPLRTYERDVAEAIRQKNESVTSINLAAQKKQIETGEKKPAKQTAEKVAGKGLTLLISVVLLLAGSVFAFWLYYFFSMRQEAPAIVVQPAIITADENREIEIGTITNEAIVSGLRNIYNQSFDANKLVSVELEQNSLIDSKKISAEQFFSAVAVGAPSSLARALGPDFVLGFRNSDPREFFLISEVASFNNSFDGMLRWEKSLKADLDKIFIKPESGFVVSGNKPFEDLYIRNKDARVLKDEFGNVVLIYSFLDQENLLITTDESLFSEILNRFFASKTAR